MVQHPFHVGTDVHDLLGIMKGCQGLQGGGGNELHPYSQQRPMRPQRSRQECLEATMLLYQG